jgi:hypothetical protein
MAGSLIKIAETTVSSAVSSVTLTGIDSTYDVYMVKGNDVVPSTDGSFLSYRFTVSGTADSSANYDHAYKILRTDTSFSNNSNTNQTSLFELTGGTGTGEATQFIHYLFNFNNPSEYSFINIESTGFDNTPILAGFQGGGVLTVTQACDGYNIFYSTGNIASGTFTLFGLKK